MAGGPDGRTGMQITLGRLAACVAGTAAAAGAWFVVVPLLGVELSVGGAPVALTAFVASGLASTAAGWAVLERLERLRRVRRPVRVWTLLATAVLVLSLAGPLLTPGIGTSGRIALTVGHLTVFGVTVLLMTRTARRATRHG